MKKNKIIFFILSGILLLLFVWILLPDESAEVQAFTYEVKENRNELIFEVEYELFNNTDKFGYATIVLDSFFYERVKNPESIEPIFLDGSVMVFGSKRIIINKEDLTSSFIESLKSKETNPFLAISVGEEINVR